MGFILAVNLIASFFLVYIYLLISQLASEIVARTLTFFQKDDIYYEITDHMDVGLVITSLSARFSVFSWPTHLGSWTTNIHHTYY